MGVGHARDVLKYAQQGVDLFDCVLPTRLARNGTVWSDSEGNRLDLGRRGLLSRSGPIAADCVCQACAGWPLGALAALFQPPQPLPYPPPPIPNPTLPTTRPPHPPPTTPYP